MRDLEASLVEQRTGQTNPSGCVKTPNDLARYRLVLDKVRPELVIETGTFSGKSALWFSQWCDVITIDTHPQVDEETLSAWAGRVTCIMDSSIDAADYAKWAAMGKRVLVSLDSDHSASHVLAEMHAYGPLVTMGSYMVVEDTIVRWCPHEMQPIGPYEGSPLDAVEHYFD